MEEMKKLILAIDELKRENGTKELKEDVKHIVRTVGEIQIKMAENIATNSGEHNNLTAMISDAKEQLREYKKVSDSDDSKIVKALSDQSIGCNKRFIVVEKMTSKNSMKITYAMGIFAVILFLVNLFSPILRNAVSHLFGE